MSNLESHGKPWRCLFCRMHTGVRLFRIPVCDICRDQLQDFVWVTVLQTVLVLVGFTTVAQFIVEEVLLFVILVLVKHQLPNLFDRYTEGV